MRSKQGSSPLTRGARPRPPQASIPAGLIPAHAGSTTGRANGTGHQQAHPRSRGEHDTNVSPDPWIDGSSPLTRGAHFATSNNSSARPILDPTPSRSFHLSGVAS